MSPACANKDMFNFHNSPSKPRGVHYYAQGRNFGIVPYYTYIGVTSYEPNFAHVAAIFGILCLVLSIITRTIMVFKCCVPNCQNTNNDYKMHRFPHLDEELYNCWIKRVGNVSLYNMDAIRVNRNYRVCDIHFSSFSRVDSLHKTGRTGLKARSIPTINLAGFNESPTADNSVMKSEIIGSSSQEDSTEFQQKTGVKNINHSLKALGFKRYYNSGIINPIA